MPLPRSVKRLSKKEVTIPEVRALLKGVAKGKFAGGSAKKAAARVLEEAEVGAFTSDVLVHDGNLTLPDLRTLRGKPPIALVLVTGSLVVDGLFEDAMDPETTVIVTGDLRAERLISTGFLEVHGALVVAREALFRDNDGSAEIFGDLQAGFLYTKYHSVKVHGRIRAPMVLGDGDHFDCAAKYAFVDETDDDVKGALLATLPRAALAIEGSPRGDADEWTIDDVKDDVLARLVAAGKPILQGPWPPKKPTKADAAKKSRRKTRGARAD